MKTTLPGLAAALLFPSFASCTFSGDRALHEGINLLAHAREICPDCELTDYYFDATRGSDSNGCTNPTSDVCAGGAARISSLVGDGVHLHFKRGESFAVDEPIHVDADGFSCSEDFCLLVGPYGDESLPDPFFWCEPLRGGMWQIEGTPSKPIGFWGLDLECDNARIFPIGFNIGGNPIDEDGGIVVLADLDMAASDPTQGDHEAIDVHRWTAFVLNSRITATGAVDAIHAYRGANVNLIGVDAHQLGYYDLRGVIRFQLGGAGDADRTGIVVARSRLRLGGSANRYVGCFYARAGALADAHVWIVQSDLDDCDPETPSDTSGAVLMQTRAGENLDVSVIQGSAINGGPAFFLRGTRSDGVGTMRLTATAVTIGCDSECSESAIRLVPGVESRVSVQLEKVELVDQYDGTTYSFGAAETDDWSEFLGLMSPAAPFAGSEPPGAGGVYDEVYEIDMAGGCLPPSTVAGQPLEVCSMLFNTSGLERTIGWHPEF